MSTPTQTQEQLIESIKALPQASLAELGSFINYLKFKEAELKPKTSGKDFLLSIAGIGESGETDISERVEEILAQEIDPIKGWTSERNRQNDSHN